MSQIGRVATRSCLAKWLLCHILSRFTLSIDHDFCQLLQNTLGPQLITSASKYMWLMCIYIPPFFPHSLSQCQWHLPSSNKLSIRSKFLVAPMQPSTSHLLLLLVVGTAMTKAVSLRKKDEIGVDFCSTPLDCSHSTMQDCEYWH